MYLKVVYNCLCKKNENKTKSSENDALHQDCVDLLVTDTYKEGLKMKLTDMDNLEHRRLC